MVVFVCARKEEASAVRQLIEETEQARFGHHGKPDTISLEHAVVKSSGKVMRVLLTYPMNQGPDHMFTWLGQLLREKPWHPATSVLFLLTGVCAGERGKCHLGDLMVASKAFNYQAGKRTGLEGDLQAAPTYFGPPGAFLRWVETRKTKNRMWLLPKAFPTVSEHDVLMRYIFARDKSRPLEKWIVDANTAWLQAQGLHADGPLLRGDLRSRFEQLFKDACDRSEAMLLGGNPRLSDKTHEIIMEAMAITGDFPLKPEYLEPKVRFGIWGSGAAVRADTIQAKEAGAKDKSKAFDEAKRQHREVIAIEMEAAAFYQALSDLGAEAKFLAVKGVFDFADAHKDDSFHAYGKLLAASYALAVAREWASESPQKMIAAAAPAAAETVAAPAAAAAAAAAAAPAAASNPALPPGGIVQNSGLEFLDCISCPLMRIVILSYHRAHEC